MDLQVLWMTFVVGIACGILAATALSFFGFGGLAILGGGIIVGVGGASCMASIF